MLVEFNNVRQIPDEGLRRWFKDEEFDLIVWYENDEITGFQLCYNKLKEEKALTWFKSGSYIHNKIDDGEEPYCNKMTPVLVQDGVFDKTKIAEKFKRHAGNIEPGLGDFVYNKLLDY